MLYLLLWGFIWKYKINSCTCLLCWKCPVTATVFTYDGGFTAAISFTSYLKHNNIKEITSERSQPSKRPAIPITSHPGVFLTRWLYYLTDRKPLHERTRASPSKNKAKGTQPLYKDTPSELQQDVMRASWQSIAGNVYSSWPEFDKTIISRTPRESKIWLVFTSVWGLVWNLQHPEVCTSINPDLESTSLKSFTHDEFSSAINVRNVS